MALHPYLFFRGNCREAFTRYQEVFGGELVLLTAADMPAEERPPGDTGDLIMHAALMLDGALLMASDDPTPEDVRPVKGVQVNVTFADAGEAKRVFDGLADGGEVRMPLTQTSWSPAFGMCLDRFGTPWMVSVDQPG